MISLNTKPKNKFWFLTWPFAHNNYTTIGNTIYYPEESPPPQSVIEHELIHMRQQREIGIIPFVFLYLLCMPLFWNPWRYKWEMEAYTDGSGMSEVKANAIIRSYRYGFLINRRK